MKIFTFSSFKNNKKKKNFFSFFAFYWDRKIKWKKRQKKNCAPCREEILRSSPDFRSRVRWDSEIFLSRRIIMNEEKRRRRSKIKIHKRGAGLHVLTIIESFSWKETEIIFCLLKKSFLQSHERARISRLDFLAKKTFFSSAPFARLKKREKNF